MNSIRSKQKTILEKNKNISNKKTDKNAKNNIYKKASYLFNIITIQFIFILLPKRILSGDYSCYITLKVNNEGFNQVISSEHRGNLPSTILINNQIQKLLEYKTIYITNKNEEIKLIWNSDIGSLNHMFSNLSNIESINMNYIFNSNIDMSYFCYNCINLKNFTYSTNVQSDELSNANINMSYAFYNCQKLSSIYFGKNKFGYVDDMRYMFYNCSILPSINISNFIFNSPANSSYMFYNCQSLMNAFFPSDFKIKDMEWMFYNCKELNSLNSLDINNTQSPSINISYAFKNCGKLSSIPINFNKAIVSDTIEAFSNCKLLKSIMFKVEGSMNGMNMTKMFYNCLSIKSITLKGNNGFYPNDLNSMFYNCMELNSLDLKNFTTDNVINMSYMFYNCKMLSNFNYIFRQCITKDMKGMFQNCELLKNLDLSNFRSTTVQVTWNMFKDCKSLTTLNLGNFDTSNVEDMESMFEGCSSLISLDLKNFDTSKVQYMNKMFKDCKKLETLYFPNINTISAITMIQMFYNCKNLKYLNIFSISYNAQSIEEMFEGSSNDFTFCIKENEFIPYFFDILVNQKQTKRDCSSQCYGANIEKKYIDDKKLCCNYVYNNKCYDNCPGRTKSNETKECELIKCDYYYNYEQNDCLPNQTIPDGYFVNDTELKTIDKCHEDCITCIGKGNNATTNCLTCKNSSYYLDLGNCVLSCDGLSNYTDPNTGKKICKCSNEKCLECSMEGLALDLCITCHNSENYYSKLDEPLYKGIYMNCYNNPLKYYLNNQIYYPCYFSCETCNSTYTHTSKNNHFCLSCNENYSFPIPMRNYPSYYNCYPNCTYYYYFNEQDNYTCVEKSKCPEDYQYLTEEKRQCVKSCNETEYPYEFRKKCYKECPKDESKFDPNSNICRPNCPFERPFEIVKTKICVHHCTIMQRFYKICITNYSGNKTKEVQDIILSDIQNDIVDTFDFLYINEERSVILEEEDVIYEITSTQTKSNNSEISRINLGECEESLKEFYNINETMPLYILKIDAEIEELNNPKVEYQVYYPITGFSLYPLDLSICEGMKIIVGYASDEIVDPLLHDKNSVFYNDICYTFTSENGTDISLADRQNEYIKNKRNLCEDGCNFNGYSEDEVECLCEIKVSLPLISQINIDKDKLYEFIDIKKIVNFNVMKCFFLLFSPKGIIKNIGFYLNIPTIVMYFVCMIIFYTKEFNILKTQIKDIAYAKKNYKYTLVTTQPKKPIKIKKKYKESIFEALMRLKGINLRGMNETKSENIDNNTDDINPDISSSKKSIKKRKVKFIKNKNDLSDEKTNEKINKIKPIKLINLEPKASFLDNDDEISSSKTKTNILKGRNKSLSNPPIKKSASEFEEVDEQSFPVTESNEIRKENKLIDNDTNKKDKFTPEEKQRIKDLLKYNTKELNDLKYEEAVKDDHRLFLEYYIDLLKCKHILIKIFSKDDYDSRIIKIFLIFYSFTSTYAINALFFSDETMHKIYEDGGKWNFIYQLPQIIYSAFFSYIFDWIINFFALSQDNILSLKHEPKVEYVEIKAKNILKILQIKFLFFFIISFILLLLYLYYLGCFCAVYKNTQFHLIQDTLISFFTSALYPLGINLIPGIFRIPTLVEHDKRKEKIYKFSKLLQLL